MRLGFGRIGRLLPLRFSGSRLRSEVGIWLRIGCVAGVLPLRFGVPVSWSECRLRLCSRCVAGRLPLGLCCSRSWFEVRFRLRFRCIDRLLLRFSSLGHWSERCLWLCSRCVGGLLPLWLR